MTLALSVLAVFVLTLGTGFFVAQEFAYVSADRIELSRQAAAGDRRAGSAIDVMRRLSFMLSAAQVGITVTGLLVGFLAAPAFAPVLEPALTGVGLPEAAVPGLAVTGAFIFAIVIQMVLGELFPKNLALARSEALAKGLASSTHVYLASVGWLVRVFDGSASWLLRKLGIEPVEELHHGATLEELGLIIGEAHAGGSLTPELSGVLGRALRFSGRSAGGSMVPRPDVVSVHSATPINEFVALIAEHGYSHYPVHGTTTDEVLGVAGVRELMGIPADRLDEMTMADIARTPMLVPDSLSLWAVADQMREADDEFACVVDEYSGLAGIITLEDILEELLGNIEDETDHDQIMAVQSGDWWTLDAGLRVDEAASYTGLRLPEDDAYETIAGLIVARLGRFAEPGDQLVVDGGVEITVDSLARRVPSQVRLRSFDGEASDGVADGDRL